MATALGETTKPPADSGRRKFPAWAETVLLLMLALGIAVLVKTFLLQMFFVPSGSMVPLFERSDRILVQKVSYWTEGVKRGDVVVFEDPGEKWLGGQLASLSPIQQGLSQVGLYPSGGHLVKRVIGIGGDRVKCCDDDGRITVNGVPLEEDDFIKGQPSTKKFDVEVPEGRLWVMGDNRSNSEDSRYHQDLPGGGTIPESGVVGKVWLIVWPWGRMDHIDRPDTFENPELLVSGAE